VAASFFHVASYELLSAAAPTTAASLAGNSPHHVGECATYAYVARTRDNVRDVLQLQHSTSTRGGAPSLPGVFDLVAVPSSFTAACRPISAAAAHCLVVACTDGSVRLLDPFTLTDVVAPYANVHAEMITSCTPLYMGGGHCAPGPAAPHLLCSAHTGAVVLYSLAERSVTQELEGHEFDAWCTAVQPMGGWWTTPAPLPSNELSASDETGSSGSRSCGAAAAEVGEAPTTAALLASGGDDGLCKLYDVRCDCRRATGRMRFDAGVVSITPVLDTDCHDAAAAATPYFLVGSYDESIALVDVRSMRRPVARRKALGGGVWRTSRALCPLWRTATVRQRATWSNANLQLMVDALVTTESPTTTAATSPSALPRPCGWVNTSNVLVLPLMQRGAALLPYDVRAAAEEVFGDAPLTYFFAEEGDNNGGTAVSFFHPALTKHSLVYDAAVLRPSADDDTPAVVATTSFYERRIDVWSVHPARIE
jgi:diphthine methyl ester acylhydrolase